MGKGLAEFRKASDDFKRTWEREVAMEASKLEEMGTENSILPEGNAQALIEDELTPEPLVQSADPELVVARGTEPEPLSQTAEPLNPAEPVAAAVEPAAVEPLRKQEWI